MKSDAGARPSDRLFPGTSELAARMRAFDWEATDLGPPEGWPQHLKIAVSLCLTSRIPIVMYWGPQFTVLYNDPYISFLGSSKHPRYLGAPGRDCWREIWDTIGPMLEGVRSTGEATWSKDVLMFFARDLPLEEVYVRFTFGPILDVDGNSVDGIFCPCTETTEQVVGARRVETLRKLSVHAKGARSVGAACEDAVAVLTENPFDIPLAAVYTVDRASDHAVLCAKTGASDDTLLPLTAMIGEGESGSWPLARVFQSRQPSEVDLAALRLTIPSPLWPDPIDRALVLPIPGSAAHRPAGLLVVGVSPRRVLDAAYRTFFDLVAGHIGSAIADAHAYEAERQRAEALAEIDRAKTLFFTNISHEFRTPLTLMLGPLEDLLNQPAERVQPEPREQLEVVHRNGMRLLRLVNALLDFSRIEAGRMRVAFAPIDLAAATADLASVFRSAVEKAGLRLIVDCERIEEPVYVDPEMWEKMVLNLLSNAFKFTFEGEIEVRLRQVADRVELTVRDTGVGIPARDLAHVFERFHRVEGSRGRSYEGTGIGLALVQELAKLHGGDARAESVEGLGSAFTIAIPIGSSHLPPERIVSSAALPSRSAAAATYFGEALQWLPVSDPTANEVDRDAVAAVGPLTPTAGDAARPRVLIADDNADMREYARRLLSSRFDVEAVGNGRRALEAIRARRPDLVLTDVMMPELDGFGLLAEVRADPALRDLPVIMLSARAGDGPRSEGVASGADDYLVKPFSARELVARVTTHVDLARVRRETGEQLREADRRKDEFLAILAHELRNPLAPIRTGLEVMRLGGDRPEVVERIRPVIERQVGHMVRLIDDLLDVSRITSGKIQLQRRPTALRELVHGAVEASRDGIDGAGVELALDLPDQAVYLDVDPTRFVQVLSNLLQNAAKFTDPGGRIAVTAEIVEVDGADGEPARREVALAVDDTGVGISPTVMPRVFDLFSQGEHPGRGRPGLGIGLALARHLVELHGGRIEGRSGGEGQGSTFVIRFPLVEMGQEPAAAGVAADGRPEIRRRVLIVDDNADAAETVALLVRALDGEACTANDGESALRRTAEFAPDVILLDIGMPGMDGYETCRRMRGLSAGRDATIVALTGWGQEQDKSHALEVGFDAHLTKPADPTALEDLLAGLPSAGRPDHRPVG